MILRDFINLCGNVEGIEFLEQSIRGVDRLKNYFRERLLGSLTVILWGNRFQTFLWKLLSPTNIAVIENSFHVISVLK